MKRVLILVEGFTEEVFVKQVLYPYLFAKGIVLQCTVIETREVVDGPNFRGGIRSYDKFRTHAQRLLNDGGVVAVTTLVDLYGLPDDFPGKAESSGLQPRARVDRVEQRISEDINHRRFRPFVALHEFEAFVFVDPAVVQQLFPETQCESALRRVKDGFPTPQDINDNPTTAPSKGIKNILGESYQKTVDGPLITDAIGIDQIRSECPHFDEWVTWLESLA